MDNQQICPLLIAKRLWKKVLEALNLNDEMFTHNENLNVTFQNWNNTYNWEFVKNSLNDSVISSFWLNQIFLINLTLLFCFIIFLGIIFLKKASHIKILNLFSAYYLIVYFFFTSLSYEYFGNTIDRENILNNTLFTKLFFFIAILTVIYFFLGISDLFFIDENTKLEFSLLIWCIFLAAIFLLSTTDFITIIILLECIAFSSYILVGFSRKNKFSTTSALKYLILASIPSCFFILGIALLYFTYGSFSQEFLTMLFSKNFTFDFFNNISQDFWLVINNYYLMYLPLNFSYGNEFLNSFSYKSVLNPDLFFSHIINEYLQKTNLYLEKINPSIFTNILIFDYILINSQYFLEINRYSIEEIDEISVLLEFYIFEYCLVFQYLLFLIDLLEFFCCLKEVSFERFFERGNGYPLEAFVRAFPGYAAWMHAINFFEITRLTETYTDIISTFLFNVCGFPIIYKMITFSWMFTWMENSFGLDSWDDVKNLQLFFWEEQYSITKAFRLHFETWYSLFGSFSFKHGVYIFIPTSIVAMKNFWGFLFDLEYIYLKNLIELNTNFYKNLELSQWISDYILHSLYYVNTFLIIYLILLFFLSNLLFKLTAAPFHFWAPTVYGGSPLATITFLSIFSKLTIFFFLIWIFINSFDCLKNIWQSIIFIVAFLSIFFSILGAFSEKIFKRFFVYSSMGHVGFMLIGFAILNFNGIKGSVDYIILYIISSFIVWFIIMFLTKKTITLVNLKGFYYNYPLLSFIFAITLFSLSGIPPMGGFFVKYEIFYSLLNSSFFYFSYILLFLTIISFFYYLRLIKILFFENNKIFYKNKSLNDIKLRLIIYSFFIIPFFLLFTQFSFVYLLKTILLESLYNLKSTNISSLHKIYFFFEQGVSFKKTIINNKDIINKFFKEY